MNAGRFKALAKAAVKSALVTGLGEHTLTGPTLQNKYNKSYISEPMTDES